MKNRMLTMVLTLALLLGLSLMLYPTFSNYWNTLRQTRAIASYYEEVQKADPETVKRLLEEAKAYNAALLTRTDRFIPGENNEAYEKLLSIDQSGIMGEVDIPKIGVALPVYHGTSEAVLRNGVGHLEWTSLPVGGESTHCVLTGHRGLPSAKLFTDLGMLVEGDVFMLHVNDETLTYEVDQKLTMVEKDDVSALAIKTGADYCTLVTCTPYGVNTHRMLIRGHRVETQKQVWVTSEAVMVEPLVVAPLVAFPILLVLFVLVMLEGGGGKKRKQAA